MKQGSPRNALAHILDPKAKTKIYMATVCVNMFLIQYMFLTLMILNKIVIFLYTSYELVSNISVKRYPPLVHKIASSLAL